MNTEKFKRVKVGPLRIQCSWICRDRSASTFSEYHYEKNLKISSLFLRNKYGIELSLSFQKDDSR